MIEALALYHFLKYQGASALLVDWCHLSLVRAFLLHFLFKWGSCLKYIGF